MENPSDTNQNLSEVSIHRATETDIPLCVDLRIEFQALTGGPLEPGLESRLREANQAYFSQGFAEESLNVWIARVEGAVAGCVMLQELRMVPSRTVPQGRIGLILNLHVRDKFRRNGTRESLLKEAVAHGRARQLGRLEVRATSLTEQVYRKLGWADPHGGTPMELPLT